MMVYIIGLMAVLDGVLRMAADDMPPNHAQHERSGHRDVIHPEVTMAFEIPPFVGLGQDHRLDPAILCTPFRKRLNGLPCRLN